MRPLTMALLLVLGLFLVACGDDDAAKPANGGASSNGGNGGEQNGNDPTATPPPERQVNDEEYLAIVCAGLDDFTDAVLSAESAEELTTVVEDYVADLRRVSPPEDVRDFHGDYIAYLEGSIDEPTELLTSPRPLPEDDVRQRLADKEASVSECEDASFFSEREESNAE